MRNGVELLGQLSGSLQTGLPPESVVQSRDRFGVNQLTPLPREPLWKKFLAKFDEPIIKILLAAALLSMAVDLFKPPAETARYLAGAAVLLLALVVSLAFHFLRLGHWIPSVLFLSALALCPVGLATAHFSLDGFAVMVAVVLATGVSFLSEYKSDREFELLNIRKTSARVKVMRGGAMTTVAVEEVVVGDLVTLEAGDEVPADGRIVKAASLHVDQSVMTGEPEPVVKQPCPLDELITSLDHPGGVCRGTQVVDGAGQMIVTEVGDETFMGHIARSLASDDGAAAATTRGSASAASVSDRSSRIRRRLTVSKETTPLQQKLQRLAEIISKVGYLAAAAIFIALVSRGLFLTTPPEVFWPSNAEDILTVAGNLLQYFLYMVIIIVVAVPEGLPMSVTVSLALAMRKMTRANSLVRQLAACETIGSTTVICTDKTGTLTQNKMQVVRVCVPDQPEASATESLLEPVAVNAAVNSTAYLEQRSGKLVSLGNATEGALLQWLHSQGIDYQTLRQRYPPLHRVHFSSERKSMTTVVRHGDRIMILVKGSPELLLQRCSQFQASDGSPQDWTPEALAAVQAQLRDAASKAMRTLAFARAETSEPFPETQEEMTAFLEQHGRCLIFNGFVAIRDPLRDDVHQAVMHCRQAGIEVKMLTGDSIETARAIASEIGLLEQEKCLILDSDDFNARDDDTLQQALPSLRVLARARPLDKLRLVKLLQERGEVVAVTGDGTNDAPALKKADVGLAMGRSGTEVAKEASKIVLLDDAFSTIVKAVHWGRALYENIQRFLQFQLTINVSALVIALLGPVVGVKPPFTILQLLWINVIMDTLAAIALCSEPPRPGLMRLPPKRRDENILTRPMLWNLFTTAAFFVVVMIALLLGMKHGGWFAENSQPSAEFPGFTARQVSIFFTTYVFFQIWNEINCRSLTPEVSGLGGLHQNPVFLGIIGLIVTGQVLIVTFGGEVFKVVPLQFTDWLIIAAATSSVLIFAEVSRRLRLAMQ